MPAFLALALAAVIGAVASLAAARLGTEGPLSRRTELIVLAAGALAGTVLALSRADSLPLVALVALGAGLLVGSAASDLRERMVHVGLLAAGVGGMLVLAALGPLGLRAPLLGLLFGAGAASLLFAGGWIFSHLRGGIDPETGERSEDYGSGDIVIWALVGVMLAALPDGFERLAIAFLAAHLLVGVASAAILLARPLHARLGGADYLPLVPAIATVTLVLAAIGTLP